MSKLWKLLDPAPESFLKEHSKLSPLVANLLYHRNLITKEKIEEFLNPDYAKDVHDPYLFRDMPKATARIFKAIENNEKIIVHGDYDADGVSSAVILISALKTLGAKNLDVFLPHREEDGYGLNKKNVKIFFEQKVNLIITCDCGVSNVEEIDLANELGIDVIVTDHHTIPTKAPNALAIIHPLISNETYPDKGLAGAGVAFKLVQGLLKKHRETNETLPNGEKHESVEKWFLDMVAIATVADMVPLLGESRTLTKYGLLVLNKTRRIGLQKLLLEARLIDESGGKKRDFDSYTISFQIAPRINAAGRMNHANAAYNLLMTEDPEEAAELAHNLDLSNQERQKMTEDLVKRAIEQIEVQKNDPVLFIYGENWSPGIVGLISGKIKDKYNKPTLVMTKSDGEIVGSGRSVEGFSLIKFLQSVPYFFQKFGGHPMACGFTLKDEKQIPELKRKMIEQFNIDMNGINIQPTIIVDAEIDLDHIDWKLFETLEKFKPFGQNNEKSRYLARGVTVRGLEPVGKDGKHLRIMVKHNSEKIKKTIGWDLCNENNCHCLDWNKELKIGDKIDMVFEVDVNEWNGNRELQLTIIDLKKL